MHAYIYSIYNCIYIYIVYIYSIYIVYIIVYIYIVYIYSIYIVYIYIFIVDCEILQGKALGKSMEKHKAGLGNIPIFRMQSGPQAGQVAISISGLKKWGSDDGI